MMSSDGTTVVVFNGEIYNHAEIRRELEREGRRFRTRCDTEVVVEAFARWDVSAFSRLRGMFAVALWQERSHRLVLARDRLGIKPLYHHHRAGHLHFASELKALLEHPDVERELDWAGLDAFLSLNYVPAPRTLVRGVSKLLPGHWLEYCGGTVRTERYWSIPSGPPAKMALREATERLDDLLKDAVREQLVSDVPLGIWSSGGLDSSTVLHYAAQTSAQRPRTFSASFASPCCDESRYFRHVARHYGADHHEVEVRPGSDALDAIEDMAFYSDEPGADAGALPVWFLARMTSRSVTVALSGDGGDELFGGYLTYMADRAAERVRALPRALLQCAGRIAHRAIPVSDCKIGFDYKVKRFLEGALLHPDEAHLFWNGAFSAAQKRALLEPSISSFHLLDLFRDLPEADVVGSANRYMLLDQQYYLPDNILYKVDRMSMAHSLEVRPALLDHRIVEFAASLPQHLKIRGARQKHILKVLMKGKLPPAVLRRQKRGFDIPAHEWFRGFLRPMLLDTVNRQTLEQSGIFRSDATLRLIRDHMERRVNAGYQLWGLLTLFLWLKKWGIQAVPLEARHAAAADGVLAGMN